jgi:hypothetical protein
MSVRSGWHLPGVSRASNWLEGTPRPDESPGELDTANARRRGRFFLLALLLAQLLWLGVGAFALYRLVT